MQWNKWQKEVISRMESEAFQEDNIENATVDTILDHMATNWYWNLAEHEEALLRKAYRKYITPELVDFIRKMDVDPQYH